MAHQEEVAVQTICYSTHWPNNATLSILQASRTAKPMYDLPARHGQQQIATSTTMRPWLLQILCGHAPTSQAQKQPARHAAVPLPRMYRGICSAAMSTSSSARHSSELSFCILTQTVKGVPETCTSVAYVTSLLSLSNLLPCDTAAQCVVLFLSKGSTL